MAEIKEIDLGKFVKLLVKRIWIIALCAVILGSAVFVYTRKIVKPSYTATVTMYVNNNSGNNSTVSSANLAVALQLVKTYVNIIRSDAVLDKVISETGLLLSASEIRGMMSAESVNETEMFRLQVTSTDPQMSADIANAVANIAPGEISSIIEGSYAKVVDYAKVPTSPSSPNYVMNTLVGCAAGAVLAVIGIAIATFTDTRIKNEEELATICAIPVLGRIPDMTEIANSSAKKVRR